METEKSQATAWTKGAPDTCTLSVCGFQIAAYRVGAGPVDLVLLHGAGLDSAMLSWREVLAEFSAKWGDALTVYALDLPGYGASTRPGPAPDETFYPRMVEVVHAAAGALGLTQFALAGLSMGGGIAIAYALQYPEMVTALMPVDSWGLARKMPFHRLCWWYMHKTNWTQAGFSLYAKHRGLVEWALGASLIGDKAKITDAMIDEVWAACKAPDAGHPMEDFQRASITKTGCVPYYGARLAQLKMPVLFLNGEKDSLVTVKQAKAAAAVVPGARLVILPGCLHWAPKQMPELFCRTAAEFLAKRLCQGGT
ncbi:MAG: alpha/beta hydrolase [Faecalibacterium sp.]|nr:alpha/beta hydrolase [Faecalibacterium sp.]